MTFALARFWPIGAALGAGALAALAHPPMEDLLFGFGPGLFGYALLLWLADGPELDRGPWSAFGIGWLAGFSYFLIGCWWVAEAFLVDREAHAWMAPFAATLLPAGLALFWGGACAVYRRLDVKGPSRALLFAACLAAFEWLRGHVLTGFPWNLPGAVWEAGSAPSQAAAWVGVYGLTFLTVLAFAAFAPLFAPGNRKRRIGMAVLGALVVAVLHIAGAVRLAGASEETTNTVVRIVQADVPQEAKWDKEKFDAIVRRYLNLTARPGRLTPDIVIWPEGALPAAADDLLGEDSEVAAGISRSLLSGQTLLMGAYREELRPGKRSLYFNSLFAVHKDGARLEVASVYDKHRLVPFGEYLPFEETAERIGLKELVHVGDGFSPGPRPRPIALDGAPRVQPLICYESLFPGLPSDKGGRPGWIVNASNDAWFGRTSGPKQHFNLASYRAIEEGLPIVRSTPTGVSAVIDPYGRSPQDQRLHQDESGVIDARLPKALEPTLYARTGDLGFLGLIVAAFAVALWSRRPRLHRPQEDEAD